MEYSVESTIDKLNYLAETKEEIADAITEKQDESYDAHSVFVIDLERSERRLSSFDNPAGTDDQDFLDYLDGLLPRIGNTDYYYTLREDGCFAILGDNCRWIFPKGIILSNSLIQKIEETPYFLIMTELIDNEIKLQQNEIFAFADGLFGEYEDEDAEAFLNGEVTAIETTNYYYRKRSDGRYSILRDNRRYILPKDIVVDEIFKNSIVNYYNNGTIGSEIKIIDYEIRRQRYIASDDTFRSYAKKIDLIRVPEAIPFTVTKNGIYRAPENTGFSPLTIEVPSDPNSSSKQAVPVSTMKAGQLVTFEDTYSEWCDISEYAWNYISQYIDQKIIDEDLFIAGSVVSSDDRYVYMIMRSYSYVRRELYDKYNYNYYYKYYIRRYSTVKEPEEYYYLKINQNDIEGVFEEVAMPEKCPYESGYYEAYEDISYKRINKKDISGSPIENGLYERSGDKAPYQYFLSEDTEVVTGKTYYIVDQDNGYAYKETEDMEVQANKKYYQKCFSAEDEYYEKIDNSESEYELVENPESNPKTNGYYEKKQVDKYYKVKKPYGSPIDNLYYEKNTSISPPQYNLSQDITVDENKDYYKINRENYTYNRTKDESIQENKEYYIKIEKEELEDIYYFDYDLNDTFNEDLKEEYELTTDVIIDKDKTYYERRLKGANPWNFQNFLTLIEEGSSSDSYFKILQDGDIGLVIARDTGRIILFNLLTSEILHDFIIENAEEIWYRDESSNTKNVSFCRTIYNEVKSFQYFDNYICFDLIHYVDAKSSNVSPRNIKNAVCRINLTTKIIERSLIEYNLMLKGGIDYYYFRTLPNQPGYTMRFDSDDLTPKTLSISWKNPDEYFVVANIEQHYYFDYLVSRSKMRANDVYVLSNDSEVDPNKNYYVAKSPRSEGWLEEVYPDDHYKCAIVERNGISSMVHNTGDWVVIDDKVYEVTSIINISDSFEEGTNITPVKITDSYYEYDSKGEKVEVRVPETTQKLHDPIWRYFLDQNGIYDKLGFTDFLEGDDLKKTEELIADKYKVRIPLEKYLVPTTDEILNPNKQYYTLMETEVDLVDGTTSPKMKGYYVREDKSSVTYQKIDSPSGDPYMQHWYIIDKFGNYVPSEARMVSPMDSAYYKQVRVPYSYIKSTDIYPTDLHTYYKPIAVIAGSADVIAQEIASDSYTHKEFENSDHYFILVENPEGSPKQNGYYEHHAATQQGSIQLLPIVEDFDVGGYGWAEYAGKAISPIFISEYYSRLAGKPVGVIKWDILLDAAIIERFVSGDKSKIIDYRLFETQYDIRMVDGHVWGWAIMFQGHGCGQNDIWYCIMDENDQDNVGVISSSVAYDSSTGQMGPFDMNGNLISTGSGKKSVYYNARYIYHAGTAYEKNDYLHYFVDDFGTECLLASFDRIYNFSEDSQDWARGKIIKIKNYYDCYFDVNSGGTPIDIGHLRSYQNNRAAIILKGPETMWTGNYGYFPETQKYNEIIGIFDFNTLSWSFVNPGLKLITKNDLFFVVNSPFGNPVSQRYYEKINGEYIRSEDERIVDGKTYYQSLFYNNVYDDGFFIVANLESDIENYKQRSPKENGYYEIRIVDNFYKVSNPHGNPHQERYYERTGEKKEEYQYLLTRDTSVDDSKTYYATDDYRTTYILTSDEEYVSGKVYYLKRNDENLFSPNRLNSPYDFEWLEKKGKEYVYTNDLKYRADKKYYKIDGNPDNITYIFNENPIAIGKNMIVVGERVYYYKGKSTIVKPNTNQIMNTNALGYITSDIYEIGNSQSISCIVDDIDEV